MCAPSQPPESTTIRKLLNRTTEYARTGAVHAQTLEIEAPATFVQAIIEMKLELNFGHDSCQHLRLSSPGPPHSLEICTEVLEDCCCHAGEGTIRQSPRLRGPQAHLHIPWLLPNQRPCTHDSELVRKERTRVSLRVFTKISRYRTHIRMSLKRTYVLLQIQSAVHAAVAI